MAIDFPANPVIGQTTGLGNLLYTWDGLVWRVSGGTGGGFEEGVYLPLTGGTMTGPLYLHADPSLPLQAVTKQYADFVAAQLPPVATSLDMVVGVINDKFATPLATMGLTGSPVTSLTTINKTLVPAINELKASLDFIAAGGSFVGAFNATAATITWTQASGQTGNELPPPAPANKGWYLIADVAGDAPPSGAPATHYDVGDWVISTGTQWMRLAFGGAMVQVIASAVTVNPAVEGQVNVQLALEALSNLKVSTSGIAVPDQIVVFEGPTGRFIKGGGKTIAEMEATLKTYTDDADALRVLKAGDTMAGPLNVPVLPLADANAASKKYVDDKVIAAGEGNAVFVVGPELSGDGLGPSPIQFNGISRDASTFSGSGLSTAPLTLHTVDGGTF